MLLIILPLALLYISGYALPNSEWFASESGLAWFQMILNSAATLFSLIFLFIAGFSEQMGGRGSSVFSGLMAIVSLICLVVVIACPAMALIHFFGITASPLLASITLWSSLVGLIASVLRMFSL